MTEAIKLTLAWIAIAVVFVLTAAFDLLTRPWVWLAIIAYILATNL